MITEAFFMAMGMKINFKVSNEMSGMLLAIAGIFMFSAKAVMVKVAYRYGIDAVSLLLLRMVFSMPVYLLILLLSVKKATPQEVSRKDYLNVVFLGFVGYYLASYFDFQGLLYITASLERLILFAYPTMVVFISAIFLRKKISQNQIELRTSFKYFAIASASMGLMMAQLLWWVVIIQIVNPNKSFINC